jgi:hypothetical protein
MHLPEPHLHHDDAGVGHGGHGCADEVPSNVCAIRAQVCLQVLLVLQQQQQQLCTVLTVINKHREKRAA